jgi:tungstate transport system ATP-binding protein
MVPELIALREGSVQAGHRRLISNVSLAIHAGERVAVLGANGAGKSTLLRALHGIVPLASGERRFDPTAQQAMIFQHPPILRTSVLGQVLFALQSVPNIVGARGRAMAALKACALDGFTERRARSLSGGEQQRLALACAWACAPAVLFADEPTASLDFHATPQFERLLLDLNAQGCTLVVSTHSLGQAKRLSRRVLFMHEGTVTDDCETRDFFSNGASKMATAFLEGERG